MNRPEWSMTQRRAVWLGAYVIVTSVALAAAEPSAPSSSAPAAAGTDSLGIGAVMGGVAALLWAVSKVLDKLPLAKGKDTPPVAADGIAAAACEDGDATREVVRQAQRQTEQTLRDGFDRLVDLEQQQTLVLSELRMISAQQKDLIASVHARLNDEHDRLGGIRGRVDQIHEAVTRRGAA